MDSRNITQGYGVFLCGKLGKNGNIQQAFGNLVMSRAFRLHFFFILENWSPNIADSILHPIEF